MNNVDKNVVIKKVRKNISLYYIFLLLWYVYNFQSTIFGTGGNIIAKLIMIIFLLISIYYFIYVLIEYKIKNYILGLIILIFLFTIYGIELIFSKRILFHISLSSISVVENYQYLKNIYLSLLPFFPIYVFARKKKLSLEKINFEIPIFIFLSIISFFILRKQQLAIYSDDSREITNNIGYIFVSIIPLIVLYNKNKITQYILLSIVSMFIFLSFKRGAIVIGSICIVIFVLDNVNVNKYKLMSIILNILLLVFCTYLVFYLLNTSEYFNSRIYETINGKSSGRDKFYNLLIYHIKYNSSWINLFWGNGANSTFAIIGNYAHNDWLEIMINQGILGVVIYIIYWLLFLKTIKNRRENHDVNFALKIIFVIYFLQTLFSMSYSGMTIYSNICMGYCLAKNDEYDEELNK